MSEFESLYKNKVVKNLKEKFKYSNDFMVPKIEKITLNMGVGEAAVDKKHMTTALDLLTKISGQKPLVTKSRLSIAGFKIRENWPIGCKVTLRGKRMYEFLERLVTVAIPRIRDFRGLKSNLDGHGNYSMGLKDCSVFPEISYEDMDILLGLDVTITTSARTDKEAKELLLNFDFPFRDR
ncbi:MAG: rplE [Gammaproteobacteria bacterium]|jgi:large subunit ribosomal protein L5|nr:rplE [Gammaproteobacteria bacterium]